MTVDTLNITYLLVLHAHRVHVPYHICHAEQMKSSFRGSNKEHEKWLRRKTIGGVEPEDVGALSLVNATVLTYSAGLKMRTYKVVTDMQPYQDSC